MRKFLPIVNIEEKKGHDIQEFKSRMQIRSTYIGRNRKMRIWVDARKIKTTKNMRSNMEKQKKGKDQLQQNSKEGDKEKQPLQQKEDE